MNMVIIFMQNTLYAKHWSQAQACIACMTNEFCTFGIF
jgi:hypothetical protein